LFLPISVLGPEREESESLASQRPLFYIAGYPSPLAEVDHLRRHTIVKQFILIERRDLGVIVEPAKNDPTHERGFVE
jgi:hypothetical protein